MNTRIRYIMFVFPLVLLFLLVAVDPMTLGTQAAAQSGGGPFLAPEILGRPTNHSVAMNVIPTEDLEVYAEFGSTSGAYTAQTQTASHLAGTPFDITSDGLQPNTRTHYRIRYRQIGAAEFSVGLERSFWTQRAAGSTFTFDIQGDTHPERVNKKFAASLYTRALLNAAADRPDLYMTIGDDFSVDTLKIVNADTVTQLYINQRQYLGLVGAPVFLVNGNHDGELGWKLNGTADNLAVWATQARHLFYPNPAPGGFYSGSTVAEPFIGVRDGYYAWTWGDALFVVLDPFWYSTQKPRTVAENWNYTVREAQYQWLKQTLETSSARFKFVFAHNLVGGMDTNMRGGIEAADKFEWGCRNADGSSGVATYRSGWAAPIHQLLVQNHVTIFFHGHDHLFVKQDLDGIVYQECPQPNYVLYDRTGNAADYGYTHGDVLGCCGYLRITVSPSAVTVDYVRSYLPQDENAQRWSGQVSYTTTVAAP